MSNAQSSRAIHTIWGVMPKSYPNLLNFFHGLVDHDYPFFSTMLTRRKLNEVHRSLSINHGEHITFLELHGLYAGHAVIIVAYCPNHFCQEGAIPNLIHEIRRKTLTAHHGSNLTAPDRC